MRRTRQEALETRERILDCAERVFFDKGVTHTSLEDIAMAAGVTRGAIYGHFKNKIDVFDAMVNRVQLPMEAFVEATTDPREADPLGQMRKVLVMCLTDVARNSRTHRVFDVLFTKCEYSAHMEALLERTSTSAREGRARLARGLRNASKRGQLPDDLDARRAAAALHAMIGGVLRDWLLDHRSMSLPGDAARIADASLDMLRFSTALRKQPRVG
jgi:TetR/AcrR family acrAB operon transcriptional repressor